MQTTSFQKLIKIIPVLAACLLVGACASSKKNVSMRLHSDPLGAYALMQVVYKNDTNPDWVFLGPTPIIADKQINMSGATSVSLRVIRQGFHEQTKTWKASEFLKEQRKNKEIVWIPNLVSQ